MSFYLIYKAIKCYVERKKTVLANLLSKYLLKFDPPSLLSIPRFLIPFANSLKITIKVTNLGISYLFFISIYIYFIHLITQIKTLVHITIWYCPNSTGLRKEAKSTFG